jgi:molecular chaperone DnaK (HSP70)
MTARYVVGIDLGTTNCAVAAVDSEQGETITSFPITQVTSAGEVEARPLLPSFLLLPTEAELPPEAMTLPWAEAPAFTIGTLARERGSDLPHRVVSSAKSWLCHKGIDRHAPVLPWRGVNAEVGPGDEGRLVSPVEATSLYLEHIRAAWNQEHPDAPLEEQDVFLTVPASFDAVARELTATAAHQAGLANVVLLEEPQAAFYAWLAGRGDAWRKELHPGDSVLVCDVGGGTTDLSVIEVVDDAGNLALERVAVGDHILLGGDNMDLALAFAAGELLGQKLDPLQERGLVHACRQAKERLLAREAPEKVPVAVLGRGSRLIGNTLRTDLRREHVEKVILEGFFPAVEAGARPQRRRTAGLRELGLPYAYDPAITRHLAEFLGRHAVRPTAILFNGGVMKGELLRRRVATVLGGWSAGEAALRSLEGNDLDLAVAQGAAYYGLVRRGRGIRIRGGTARAYYIGIESAAPAIPGAPPPIKALCVAPFGQEEGTTVAIRQEELGLVVGEKAEFRFFAASNRPGDRPGALVDADAEGMEELEPVDTTLPLAAGDAPASIVPVTLSAHVTAVGTLELFCEGRPGNEGRGRWRLEYGIRGQSDAG